MIYIKKWGSRLKNIIQLYKFLGLNKTCSLLLYFVKNVFLFSNDSIINFDLRRIQIISKWLDNKYGYLVPTEFAIETEFKKDRETNEPIWVLWYQGKENMPEIVNLCYQSILKNSNNHPVHLITKENLICYMELPNFIYKKVERKQISYTHLSDIIRINLLYKYGGLWIDSTTFITAPIETGMFNPLFYSIKNVPLALGTISNYRWAGFYLYSMQGSPAFKVFINLFFEYWKSNNALIDYFLIDYFFDLLYKKNKQFRKEVDCIPITNPHLHLLTRELNKTYNKKLMQELNQKTSAYKLTYKVPFIKKINGEKTLYGYLIDTYLYK